MKFIVLVIPAFLAGAISFYALQQRDDNQRLVAELAANATQLQRLEELLAANEEQRVLFEAQIQQLQGNLQGTQSQLINLSSALQSTRSSITPAAESVAEPAADLPTTAPVAN